MSAQTPEKYDLSGSGSKISDFCSNVIVNPDTMDVVGIIDWEFAEYGNLSREFRGVNMFRNKMRRSNLLLPIVIEYYKLCEQFGGKIV